ncbi:uncharacterized protein LOC134244980 [Saccostrea cucullata]|uniref:uncharacterized protein LOC134244980 n=1 Tax=Saccostrea cuccullata TaxID=36930 RepID=UPI002ED198C9
MGDFNSRVGILKDWFEADDFQLQLQKCEDLFKTAIETRTIIFDNFKIPLHRVVQDVHVNNFGYKMIDFCKNNDIYIVNGRAGSDKYVGGLTCKGSSTVDYVVATAPMFKFIKDFDISDFCNLYSDVHNPVSFSILPALSTKHRCEDIVENQSRVKLWSQDQAKHFPENVDISKVKDIENELDILTSSTETSNISKDTLNEVTNKLCGIFLNTAKSTFGVSRNFKKDNCENKRNKPWFNKECKTARKKYHLAKRLNSKNPCLENKANLQLESKKYKKIMDSCIKDYRKGITKNLKSLRSTNTREYWKILNGPNAINKCAVDINAMFDFLKGINEGHDNDIEDVDTLSFPTDSRVCDDFLNFEISEEEILCAVKRLKNNKAAGYDQLLNEHISSTIATFLPVYKKMFNLIFDSGIIPDEWLTGIVKPIFKNKGDPTNPENYRPITLLSCLGIRHSVEKWALVQTFE